MDVIMAEKGDGDTYGVIKSRAFLHNKDAKLLGSFIPNIQ